MTGSTGGPPAWPRGSLCARVTVGATAAGGLPALPVSLPSNPRPSARLRLFVSVRKVWDDWERGQLARWVQAGKLPALPVRPRAYDNSQAV